MMKVSTIPQQLLFSTVRIVAETAANDPVTGTAFVFSHKVRDTDNLFLVTNKHVVKDTGKGRLTFTQSRRGEPLIGTGFTIERESFERTWVGHPDPNIDVAISSLGFIIEQVKNTGVELFYRAIASNLIPTEDQLNKLDALEDVIFIGYPNGLWDKKNLLPIFRSGITATPITVDFQGERQFLIDASVFPGSSGSPVFLYDRPSRASVIVAQAPPFKLLFLGIVASVYQQHDLNEIILVPNAAIDVPMALSKQMIDLGVVFKAATIVETIDHYFSERGFPKGAA
jgi:hypothetical protein